MTCRLYILKIPLFFLYFFSPHILHLPFNLLQVISYVSCRLSLLLSLHMYNMPRFGGWLASFYATQFLRKSILCRMDFINVESSYINIKEILYTTVTSNNNLVYKIFEVLSPISSSPYLPSKRIYRSHFCHLIHIPQCRKYNFFCLTPSIPQYTSSIATYYTSFLFLFFS